MISVVVPIYNIKPCLERCVQSILGQIYHDFELILVDDGSTDGSGELCDYYAKLDKRVQVVHKENGGLSDARNAGTRRAKGEWITYIDGDDYVEPCYLAELYTLACEEKAQISVVQLINSGKKQKKEKEVLSGREAAARIVRYNDANMICACGKLYHRELFPILEYPCGKLHEDEFVTYRAFYAAERVAVSSKHYYNYVVRENSITQEAYSRRRLDKLKALKGAVRFFKEEKDEELMAYAKLRYFLNLQIAWYRVKKSSVIKEKEGILCRLEKRRRYLWKKEKAVLWRRANLTEKITILIFSLQPDLYSLFCTLYLSTQEING